MFALGQTVLAYVKGKFGKARSLPPRGWGVANPL